MPYQLNNSILGFPVIRPDSVKKCLIFDLLLQFSQRNPLTTQFLVPKACHSMSLRFPLLLNLNISGGIAYITVQKHKL